MNLASILIGLGIIGLLIIYFSRWKRFSTQRPLSLGNKKQWQEKWKNISNLEQGDFNHKKLALIEADQLVDLALKSLHVPGDDTGERVKFMVQTQPHLYYIYNARRFRNKLVHEANFTPNPSLLKQAIKQYYNFLHDLNVL